MGRELLVQNLRRPLAPSKSPKMLRPEWERFHEKKMESFWDESRNDAANLTRNIRTANPKKEEFPLARVKRIMKIDSCLNPRVS